MKTVVFGFFGEGKRDAAYVQRIVERTVIELLPQLEIVSQSITSTKDSQAEKMIDAAEQAMGYHFLIIHLDADNSTLDRAYEERFMPGYVRIQTQENVNKHLIPVIPIRMTEAWMLVDFSAFQQVTKTKLSQNDLRFPRRAADAEKLDAKVVFESAVRHCQPGRKRKIPADEVYIPLSSIVSLDKLRELSAFQLFEADLQRILRTLHYLT
jgi:hypothetical protein